MAEAMTAEGPDAPGSSLTDLLHRAARAVDAVFHAEAKEIGVTSRQFAVLVAVAYNRDITPDGLVQVTGMDRSIVAEIVKGLQQRGAIKRKRTHLEARTYALLLTREGEALLLDAGSAAARAEQRLALAFGARYVAGLTGALAHLVEAFEPSDEARPRSAIREP